MSNLICVALPDGRWLALDREVFAAALAAGAEVMARPPSPTASTEPLFVDAAEMGRLTDTAASWWESAARDLDCPSLFVGRVRRFKVAECLVWLESVQERAVDGRALKCGAAPRARA
ncbi:MAG TPA: hypothetical protein VK251_11850 [Steroidobacteraceae bacterium]|nr:hypothetical protein [Steroidobacteraceae bacterium]